ncbi:Phage-related minor tail protein [Methyloligella halotolerans]|uniref:Phage-related minor tail protein n=1 Tax=Methyloligella halotolerans TaxID=1177755 RepID=A0A1E2RY73_9HYPH|nr:phage tail tape measure protein [Methyloligella halotolerans]ODA67100.1 Phage-related minor tail protein [Methyloligella halotolerans]
MTDLHARAIITAVDGVSGPMAGMARKFAAMERSWSQSIGNIGAAMASTGRAMTMAVTLPAGLMLKAAADWQEGMLEWKKAEDKLADPAVYERAKQTIKSLARELPLSQVELTDLASAASRAGVAFEDVRGFVALSAKAADAFGESAADAGSMLASIKQSAGLSNDELNKLIGRMDMLENSMNVRGKELIDYHTRIGAIGRQAGFSNAEIAAMGATMRDAGIDVEQAATASKNLFKVLVGGESLPKPALAIFKRLGIDADEFAQQVQEKPIEALGMLRDRLREDLPEHQQLAALFELFKDQAAPAIALLFQNWDKYLKARKMVADEEAAQNQLNESFATTMEGLGKKLKVSRNLLTNIADVFATRWMPTIDKALERADEWMSQLEDQPRMLRAVADGVGALAVAGPAMWIVGSGLKGIGDAAGVAGRALAGLARMGIWRLTAIGAAVWGLYKVGKAVYDGWDEKLADKWTKVSEAGKKLASAIAELAGKKLPEGWDWSTLTKGFNEEILENAGKVLEGFATAFERYTKAVNALRKGDYIEALKHADQAIPSGIGPNPISSFISSFTPAPDPASAAVPIPSNIPGPPVAIPYNEPSALSTIWDSYQDAWDRFSEWMNEDPSNGPALPAQIINPPPPGSGSETAPLLRDIKGGPQMIDVTGKVKMEGAGNVRVHVTVDGPGKVTGMSAHDDGKNLQLDVGTSMPDSGAQ